ncbi:MAG: hypothetical protein ACI8SE_000752 [Bacteroidia bacterium]|jgi:hypothetical protein
MKRVGIILLAGLVSTSVYSQEFETSLTVSPRISFSSNYNSLNKLALGGSASIQSFYKLSEKLAVGSEFKYSFENYRLKRNYQGGIPHNATAFCDISLTNHTLNVPLLIRLKTKSNWLLTAGSGLNYNLDIKASTDYIYKGNWSDENVTRTNIENTSAVLVNNFNTYYR